VKQGFEVLTEAGYQPEIAYFECLHELKLIVDLMYEGGIERMYYSVSDTAEYGGLTRGAEVIDEVNKERMNDILKRVQNGSFADEWIQENKNGIPKLKKLRSELGDHQIEKVGKQLRSMMESILKEEDKDEVEEAAE
jgi:ketol-acid reductoisomerase